jgi:very-short-patch-repair endonuclease
MRGKTDQSAWARALDLARKQHHAIARRQLIALGFTAKAIEYALAVGRLHHAEWRGVYAVGRPDLTKYGRWRAALLARGPYAVLSHQTGGALWEIWDLRDRMVHLSLPAVGQRREVRNMTVHRRKLKPHDITHERGIPVTTPLRTVIDLAAHCDHRQAERLVNEADGRGLLRADTLRDHLEHADPEPGVPLLREILRPETFVLTDSELERMFLPLVRRAGLPKPESQKRFGPHRVDFYWPELNLVVEVDSLRYHRTPAQQREDRERDHAHLLAGRTQARFTFDQVARDPTHVVTTLARLNA